MATDQDRGVGIRNGRLTDCRASVHRTAVKAADNRGRTRSVSISQALEPALHPPEGAMVLTLGFVRLSGSWC